MFLGKKVKPFVEDDMLVERQVREDAGLGRMKLAPGVLEWLNKLKFMVLKLKHQPEEIFRIFPRPRRRAFTCPPLTSNNPLLELQGPWSFRHFQQD